MSVTEVVGAIGDWSVNLVPGTPRRIIDRLDYWGHIVVTAGQTNIDLVGDNIFDSARYVGVTRKRVLDAESPSIGGGGLAIWLGDEDQKGYVFETEVSFTAADFNTVINTILPPSVYVGTINTQAGTYTNKHKYKDPRTVLSYVTETFGAEWRIRGKATVDVGTVDQLYGSMPTCAIVRRLPQGGADIDIRALSGNSSLDADSEDFTTRIILLAEDSNNVVTQATADINTAKNPYKDIKGQDLVMRRMVSENDTSLSTAPTRAAMQLGRFDEPREAIRLSTQTHDLRGDVVPGGYIWVEDDAARLVDENNQIYFKGLRLRPLKLRVTELSWPIEFGMGVYYRHWDGSWIDLTPYMEWESGQTTVTVGDYDRPLTGGSGFTQPVTSAPSNSDTIAPATPTFVTPFETTLVTSEQTGLSQSEMQVKWNLPLNSDGSVIQDGDFYEIRWRTNAGSLLQPTHAEMAVYTHAQLKAMGTNEAPIQTALGTWQYSRIPWGNLGTRIPGLQPGVPYDWGIRAVDTSVPPNSSAWSANYTQAARRDTQAPRTPGTFVIAANIMSAQINYPFTSAGEAGEFNQSADIAGIEVHISREPTFQDVPESTENGGTMLGRLPATVGMQMAEAAVVGTFQIPSQYASDQVWFKVVAFDTNNNRSPASEAQPVTAELVSDAWITNLIVTKITGGIITADWIQGASIRTAQGGNRVVIAFHGIEAYDPSSVRTFDLNSSDGSFFATGTIQSGITGRRVVMSGAGNELLFYPEVGETRSGRIFSYIPTNYPNDIAVEIRSIDGDTTDDVARIVTMPDWLYLSVCPKGSGGDLVTRGRIQIGDGTGSLFRGQVYITSSTISPLTPPYTAANEITRSLGRWMDDGEILIQSNHFSEAAASRIYFTASQLRLEMLDGATRTGGFLFLSRSGSGQDTIIGHYDQSVGENFVRLMNSATDIAFYKSGVLKMKIGGVRTAIEALGSLGYGDERAILNTANGTRVMIYWQAGGTMSFGNADSGAFIKNFVIDHPADKNKYLVHACLEGPEARVEYEGIVTVLDGEAVVELPKYFEALTRKDGRAVQLTVLAESKSSDRYALAKKNAPQVIWSGRPGELHPGSPAPIGMCTQVMASYPENGKFHVYSDRTVEAFRVFWRVTAVRSDVPQFAVEPRKDSVRRMGSGPYTWIEAL